MTSLRKRVRMLLIVVLTNTIASTDTKPDHRVRIYQLGAGRGELAHLLCYMLRDSLLFGRVYQNEDWPLDLRGSEEPYQRGTNGEYIRCTGACEALPGKAELTTFPAGTPVKGAIFVTDLQMVTCTFPPYKKDPFQGGLLRNFLDNRDIRGLAELAFRITQPGATSGLACTRVPNAMNHPGHLTKSDCAIWAQKTRGVTQINQTHDCRAPACSIRNTTAIYSHCGHLERGPDKTEGECPSPSNSDIDCGFYGITQQECEAKGCCWDTTSSKMTCYPRPAVFTKGVSRDKRTRAPYLSQLFTLVQLQRTYISEVSLWAQGPASDLESADYCKPEIGLLDLPTTYTCPEHDGNCEKRDTELCIFGTSIFNSPIDWKKETHRECSLLGTFFSQSWKECTEIPLAKRTNCDKTKAFDATGELDLFQVRTSHSENFQKFRTSCPSNSLGHIPHCKCRHRFLPEPAQVERGLTKQFEGCYDKVTVALGWFQSSWSLAMEGSHSAFYVSLDFPLIGILLGVVLFTIVSKGRLLPKARLSLLGLLSADMLLVYILGLGNSVWFTFRKIDPHSECEISTNDRGVGYFDAGGKITVSLLNLVESYCIRTLSTQGASSCYIFLRASNEAIQSTIRCVTGVFGRMSPHMRGVLLLITIATLAYFICGSAVLTTWLCMEPVILTLSNAVADIFSVLLNVSTSSEGHEPLLQSPRRADDEMRAPNRGIEMPTASERPNSPGHNGQSAPHWGIAGRRLFGLPPREAASIEMLQLPT